MTLLLVSFVSGILTVLAPCVLPLLPIIIGGSVSDHRKRNPLLITGSLAVAVIVFTLLLKFSTALIDIPPSVWSIISGTIITMLGVISIFPKTWAVVSQKLHLGSRSEELLAESAKKPSYWGDVLLGAALGPVFSSCSPVYFFILATVLPVQFAVGFGYLLAYALGLSGILLLISYLGQKFVKRIAWAADPTGWFRRGIGVVFVIVGVCILFGFDKDIQTFAAEHGFFDITKVEILLLDSVTN